MGKMSGKAVYLTAIFEMDPTRHKAALLERARVKYENIFWSAMGGLEGDAEAASQSPLARDRRTFGRGVALSSYKLGRAAGLCEPLCQGLSADVEQATNSFVETRASKRDARWPQRRAAVTVDHQDALARLCKSTTLEEEQSARNDLYRVARNPALRPLMLVRSRDARIIRAGPNGKISVLLYIMTGKERPGRVSSVSAGIDADSGEELRPRKSTSRIVVPLLCSKWQEHKFLSGSATLKTAFVRRVGDRWHLIAQFKMADAKRIDTNSFLGIDRGSASPVVAALVSSSGGALGIPAMAGAGLSEMVRAAERAESAARSRGSKRIPRRRRRIDAALHEMANRIVHVARQNRAAVVMERLDNLKRAFTTKRKRGMYKKSWRRVLKRAQFGKLEKILEYKLALAGLPPIKFVFAGGTSQTCSACGHREKENRASRDLFKCVSCGFECDADVNAAVQIARRGLMKPKKGDKLHDLHMNMVASLKTRDDGGLGPLAAGVAKGLVAAHVSGPAPYERKRLDAGLGQNANPCGQNAPSAYSQSGPRSKQGARNVSHLSKKVAA